METSILDKYNAGLIPSKTNATTAAIRQVNAQHSPLTKLKQGMIVNWNKLQLMIMKKCIYWTKKIQRKLLKIRAT